LRILWFNRRDIKNPNAGGDKVVTHEIMRRLVHRGYDMTLFTSKKRTDIQKENIDGVKVR
jgi:hypothetical protein